MFLHLIIKEHYMKCSNAVVVSPHRLSLTA